MNPILRFEGTHWAFVLPGAPGREPAILILKMSLKKLRLQVEQEGRVFASVPNRVVHQHEVSNYLKGKQLFVFNIYGNA